MKTDIFVTFRRNTDKAITFFVRLWMIKWQRMMEIYGR